jgi:NADPH:quinone reductase-like Zn-dependent oxidoreductase
VDYQANHPVEAFLAKRYKDQPFDHILDTIGVQGLYLKCPRYLKKSGTFINIGGYEGGFLRMLWNAFKNWAWPSWLGGTPRKFMMMTTGATNESVEVISKFAAEGKVRTVVEGVFNIENVLEVSSEAVYNH